MAYPREFMDELIARSDIVSVVSRYVSLTRRGSNCVGLCPFHNEKTPSFSVSADKQFFHCFGCGAGGDVISFVMKIENIDFPDAVAKLAEWAGLEVPQSGYGAEDRNRKKRSLEALRLAARFFHEKIKSPGGKKAAEYLLGRGLSPQTITRFGLGYSPDEWSALLDFLTEKGYSKRELLDAGIVTAGKNGRIYDRFRNRVMFPIIDVRGAVIGFGGRVMDGGEPKYLNSPESEVFNKRKNLYALNIAKSSKADYMILAEGYMDVIALHSAGFDSAVASLGTSLTEEQAHLISKYKNRVIIAYDSDKAGRVATERAIDILKKTGLEVRVLSMSGAKDPDEFIKKFGRGSFFELIENSAAAEEYRLGETKSKYDLTDNTQKVAYLRVAISHLAKIQSSVEREIYAGKIAEETGVSRDAILAEAKRGRKKLLREQRRDEERKILDPLSAINPRNSGERYKNPRSAVAEEALVSLVASDVRLAEKASESISEKMFSSELLGRVFKAVIDRAREYNEPSTLSSLGEILTPDETSHMAAVFSRRVGESADALYDYIDAIKKEYMRKDAETDDDAIRAAAEFYKKKKGI